MAGDPYGAAVRRPGAGGNQDAARDSGGKRAEETRGRAGEGLRGSGRRAPADARLDELAADAVGRSARSGAVGTSSTLTYRPAVDTGGAGGRLTDQTVEKDSRHPIQPEPAPHAAPGPRALAIWMSTAIVATILCWTAVSVLARGSHAGRKGRD